MIRIGVFLWALVLLLLLFCPAFRRLLSAQDQTPTWYCYPVDLKSGQQMCVRQFELPYEP